MKDSGISKARETASTDQNVDADTDSSPFYDALNAGVPRRRTFSMILSICDAEY